MFIALIVFGHLFIMMAVVIYSNLANEMNWRYWASLILSSLFGMLFLRITVYSFKQLINPTLVLTLTETGVIVEKDKRNVEIGWGDIESYMICGRPSPKVEITRLKGPIGKGKGIATVDGELVCETEIIFAFGD